MKKESIWVGIFEGHRDPSVAIVQHGKLLAYMEEERLNRVKHAPGQYPLRALRSCLDQLGISPNEVAGIAINWNLSAYANGTMRKFFAQMKRSWPLDVATHRWQKHVMSYFNPEATRQRHARHWRRAFGNIVMPEIISLPHHYVHAIHAFLQSPFSKSLCLTIDGSGDQHCTVIWECSHDIIQPIRQIYMPHSLGWFYAAFTEYLGFEAYDGEYKIMGLAAYGEPDPVLKEKVRQVLSPAEDGIEYRINPNFLHYGKHTWSDRFTDDLLRLFGQPKRLPEDSITQWHKNLAYAVQDALEITVCRLARWGIKKTGIKNICVGGGVGLNVKMNAKLLAVDDVSDLFVQPLCSDGGAAAGAALGACWRKTGARPEKLDTLALGYEETDESIERMLKNCRLRYLRVDSITEIVAGELAQGQIVGWFQGRMEAGPRALGQRSILADPRNPEMRDKINLAIKFREKWRPFCPSIPSEEAIRYLKCTTKAPFMNIAFNVTDAFWRDAPAVVHMDGSVRVQLVYREVLPLYYKLLRAFEHLTGVPILLNTSFNVKGEPIVCTIADALRTFFSSGLDLLAVGSFLVRKN